MNNLIFCTKTQIAKDENCELTLEGFNAIFNSCDHKYSSTAVYFKKDIEVIELFSVEGVLIVKVNNADYTFKILVCYRKNDWPTQHFYRFLRYLKIAFKLHLILGDFNLKPNEELSNVLSDYGQVVRQPTHIAGATLDHVYVSDLYRKHSFVVCVNNVFFSGHEMVKINIGNLKIGST